MATRRAPGHEDGPSSCYAPVSCAASSPPGTETFVATQHVASPWGRDMQHGGPVSGLLARAMERHQPRDGTRITRVAVDILGAVPLGEVRTRAEVLRPGRRVELLGAVLEAPGPDGRWRPAARAQAWRLSTQPTTDAAHLADARLTPGPEGGTPLDHHVLPRSWSTGFVAALDWRIVSTGRATAGPTSAWVRMAHPLVLGEQTTPLAATVAISDVANGIGARLDPADFTFLNTDLVVQLHTPPRPGWVGLEAQTSTGPDGVALSRAVLHDESGPVGMVAQTVLVERRQARDER